MAGFQGVGIAQIQIIVLYVVVVYIFIVIIFILIYVFVYLQNICYASKYVIDIISSCFRDIDLIGLVDVPL